MIDHIETVSVFQNYTKNYNEALKDIDRKILHTFRVAKAAEMIAEGLGLGSDDIDLAWFLGILHDMGRFEEILGTGRDRFTDDWFCMFHVKHLWNIFSSFRKASGLQAFSSRTLADYGMPTNGHGMKECTCRFEQGSD